MAELDYAFIAEYASVEAGKLTAVGASYTTVKVESFPAMHLLSIAGRVRATEGTEGIHLRVSVNPPAPGVEIVADGLLAPNESTTVYDGKIGIIFAISTMVQLAAVGLVEVQIEVDGQHVRRLAFEVQPPS